MSYCVNCGVKIDNSEPKCPLCGTNIVNPNLKYSKLNYSYPKNIEEPKKKVDWKYVLKLISFLLMSLSLVTIFCDLLITRSLTWSLYVVSSATYLGLLFSFLYFKGYKIPLTIAFISTELFLFVIALLTNGLRWYLYFVLPFLLLIGLYIFMLIILINRKNKRILRILSFSMLYISISLIVIEVFTDLYTYNIINLLWSLYAVLPLGIIGVGFFILSFNKKLIDEIRRRIFI